MSATRRVLMISGDFPPFISGVGDYVDKLAGAMSELGADVTVLTSRHIADARGDDARRPFRVLRDADSFNWANRAQILSIARRYDLVHVQYPAVNYGRSLLVNLLPLLLRVREPQVRTLVTIHDFRVMRKRWQARVAPMLWGVHGLIHVDPRDLPHIHRWMPLLKGKPTSCVPIAANTDVVPCNATTRAAWRRDLGFADADEVIAFFGILYPHKGLPELIEAIETLRSRGRSVKLLILGDFDRDADWRPAMEARLNQGDIKWVRGATLARISECLHAADVAALPFHTGASTNRGSLLAALAHGLPTVTTHGPATPPDIDKQFDLSLVPPQQPAALSDAIDVLLRDGRARERMRAAALNKMAALSWPNVARETVEFYERLLATRPADDDVTRDIETASGPTLRDA